VHRRRSGKWDRIWLQTRAIRGSRPAAIMTTPARGANPITHESTQAPGLRVAAMVLPLVATVHVFEEYFGGFVEKMARSVMGVSAAQFWIINATFLAYCLLAGVLYRRRPLLLLSALALVAINAVIHTVCTVVMFDYNPGVASALTLYVPLAVCAFRAALRNGEATRADLKRAGLIGAGLMLVPPISQGVRLLLGI